FSTDVEAKPWVEANSTITILDNTYQTDGVGLQRSGAYSLDLAKQFGLWGSFELKFTKYDKKKKFQGLKSIKLRSPFVGYIAMNDSAAISERIIGDMMYAAGVPVSRYQYTQLFMNNRFIGLYLIQEQMDDQFLEARGSVLTNNGEIGNLW